MTRVRNADFELSFAIRILRTRIGGSEARK
jgi:hypothetical protein